MTYTFWHLGQPMGESGFRFPSANPAQRAGVFHPTAYGLTLLPLLTGTLTIGRAFNAHVASLGRRVDELSGDDVQSLLTESAPGRAIIALGRTLSEIELRGPDGNPIQVLTMGFSDVNEFRRPGGEHKAAANEPRSELPPEAPRYIVSATAAKGKSWSKKRGIVALRM